MGGRLLEEGRLMDKATPVTCAICAHSFRPDCEPIAGARCPRCGAVGTFAAAPEPRPRRKSLWIAALIVGAAASAVAARGPIVRVAPEAARVYAAIGMPVNLRGLAFADVKTSLIDGDGGRVLTVEGALVNLRDRKTEAPDMRIALRDSASHEIYAWTAHPPKAALAAREQAPFRLRLAAPPAGAEEVVVRFARDGEASASDERRL
jgi:hypothetical protein